jgi:hypothetical protein
VLGRARQCQIVTATANQRPSVYHTRNKGRLRRIADLRGRRISEFQVTVQSNLVAIDRSRGLVRALFQRFEIIIKLTTSSAAVKRAKKKKVWQLARVGRTRNSPHSRSFTVISRAVCIRRIAGDSCSRQRQIDLSFG